MRSQQPEGVLITEDPDLLDIDRICAWLAASYWASYRDRATIERAIAGSRCYGAYGPDGTQLALARVVTDGATFAWLCDVVVDEAWRGHGIGSALVGAVVEQLRSEGVARIALTTRDAHGVYAPLGFEPLRVARTWMEIDVRPTRPES